MSDDSHGQATLKSTGMRSTKLKTTVFVNLASTVERMDEQILPALYAFVAQSFQASPSQLGSLTLSRALLQAISSPVSGLCGALSDFCSLLVHQAQSCLALFDWVGAPAALIDTSFIRCQYCVHSRGFLL